MKITKANLAATAEKFRLENGERHAKLRELRTAGMTSSDEFNKLYEEEAQWLDANLIHYSPGHRAWYTDVAQ
jgi:hypothetical protein